MKHFFKYLLLNIICIAIFVSFSNTSALAQTVNSNQTQNGTVNQLLHQLNSGVVKQNSTQWVDLNLALGQEYYKQNDVNNAIKYLGIAVNAFNAQGNLKSSVNTIYEILNIGICTKQYSVVMQYSLEGLDVLKNLYIKTDNEQYLSDMVGLNYLIATTCNILGDKVYGQQYFNGGEAIQEDLAMPDTIDMCYVKGDFYYYQENYKESEEFVNKGIELAKSQKNTKAYYKGILHLARAQLKLGLLNEAKANLNLSKKELSVINSTYMTAEYYYYYAEYYQQKQMWNSAIEYYIKAYSYTKEEPLYEVNQNILNGLGQCYSKVGEYKNATKSYQKYVAELNEMSESKEKINATIILNMHNNDPQNILNEVKVKRTQSDNKILLVIVICFLILMGLLANSYIKKRKNIKILNRQLNRDTLTKAFNRRYTMGYISKLIKSGKCFTIGMLDIDNYKVVNDTYGHLFGDAVLKKIVKTIKIVGGTKIIVCRYGGEEFLIVVEVEDKEIAKRILENIRLGIESLEWEYGNTITASIGSSHSTKCNKIEDIIGEADSNLYKAKRTGKNKLV
ncbi:MAG: diguanylate cyclase [Sarcina sp.]